MIITINNLAKCGTIYEVIEAPSYAGLKRYKIINCSPDITFYLFDSEIILSEQKEKLEKLRCLL